MGTADIGWYAVITLVVPDTADHPVTLRKQAGRVPQV
jgi:hypothetical protein